MKNPNCNCNSELRVGQSCSTCGWTNSDWPSLRRAMQWSMDDDRHTTWSKQEIVRIVREELQKMKEEPK